MTDRAFEDDVTPAAAEAAPSNKGLSLKFLLLFVAGPLLLLVVVGGVLFFAGIWPFDSHAKAAAAPPAEEVPAVKQVTYLDLPDLLINLNSTGRKTTFLKLAIALQLESPADVPKVQAVMPRLIDQFQVYLRELRADDIKGSAGMYRLREELLARVAVAAAPVKVEDVLFREVLVQ
jgi:flagellar protein FliL